MNRFKVTGILNFLSGVFLSVYFVFAVLFVLPKLNAMFNEFNATTNTNPYVALLPIIILGVLNLFIGIKLLWGKSKNNIILYFGVGLLILNFLIGGFLVGSSVLSVLLPIYSLAQ